jgi:hypothetical protein
VCRRIGKAELNMYRVVGMSALCAVGYLRRPWRVLRTVRNVMAERSETALEKHLIEYKQRRWLRHDSKTAIPARTTS